jgi:hypothetical protein
MSETIAFRIKKEVKERLEQIARERNISLSDVVNNAINQFLTSEFKPSGKPKLFIVDWDRNCVVCNRRIPKGSKMFWYGVKQYVCLECHYKIQNYEEQTILTDICERLVKLDNELYCVSTEGKYRKILSLRFCEVCKAMKTVKSIKQAPYRVIPKEAKEKTRVEFEDKSLY